MKRTQCRSKILSSVCSAALVLTALPAMAYGAPTSPTDVPDSTVSITGLNPGDTVSAFCIADADIDASNNLTYAFDSKVPAPYDTLEGLASITSDGTSFVQNSDMQNAAAKIAAAMTTGSPYSTATAAGDGSAALTLGSGYYLVRVTATSGESYVYQNMVIDVSPEAGADGSYAAKSSQTVEVKKTPVKVEKTVGSNYVEKTDAYTVGQMVPFKITTAIPNYPADSLHATFVIGDKPTDGLEIDVNSIKINGDAAVTCAAYTITAAKTGYEITFSKEYILANPGQSIEVTYEAKLTSKAFSRSDTDLTGNTATVTFNPNPYSDATAKPDDSAKVQTYGYVFPKVGQNGNSVEALEGAVFTLYDADGNEVLDENGDALTSTSTIVNGKAYVWFEDLAAGTYTAKETVVPAGYLKAPDQTFTLNSGVCISDNPATTDIENNYLVASDDVVDPVAPKLPITGDAGVLGITAAGVVLVSGALVLIARNRRKEEN